MHNWIALSAETPGVLRDECGVPVEWTLLREGENPICQEGRDGSLRLSAEAMKEIMAYHEKKGEQIRAILDRIYKELGLDADPFRIRIQPAQSKVKEMIP